MKRIHLYGLVLGIISLGLLGWVGRYYQQQLRMDKLTGKLVLIPGGSFMMGSENGYKNEQPVHLVTIQPFYMQEHAVSFAQWDACVDAGGCLYIPSDGGWGRGARPVINVSFNDVTEEFIPWLNQTTGKVFRLPTEAEWEYAARAGTRTEFSTGDCINTEQANYNGHGDYLDCGANTGVFREQTVPVKTFPPNDFGLYEMHGNVWEWIEDCWYDNYYGASSQGRAWLGGDCSYRVLRGGSWYSSPIQVRSADRGRLTVGYRNRSLGFRLVLEP